ncbi:MAG TPA: glutaredoxin family protein [Solirubrobacteraceae bacterium]|nr:glutaredoxin family protein [Solirubrobacteraceae bacterium]
MKVTLYGRPGCHLCEDALAVIERVRARVPFELEQRDIEADEEWFKRYLERIPVVELDGHEVFELFIDQQQLEQMLVSPKSRPGPQ